MVKPKLVVNNGKVKRTRKNLVNEIHDLDAQAKKINPKLKALKLKAREDAEAANTKRLEGTNGRYLLVSPDTAKSCEAKDLLAYLEELGREDEFVDMVKVSAAEVEKLLGETLSKEIVDYDYKPFAKVSVKFDK